MSETARKSGMKFVGGARPVGVYVARALDPAARARGFATTALLADWPSIVGAELAAFTAPDRVDELAKHSADTGLGILVLYGEDDDAWEPAVQATMAERLNASKVVIPGAAHSPAWEAPETTAAALTAFWNQCAQGLK